MNGVAQTQGDPQSAGDKVGGSLPCVLLQLLDEDGAGLGEP